jgi:hypothetical protein
MQRRTHRTVILVCEGLAELEFAKVIRDAYLPRNCGTSLKAQNAFGGGGKKALFVASQLKSQSEFDSYAILIDTDEHWTDSERTEARSAEIIVVENTPCLEATLLRIDQKRASSNTSTNKDLFLEEYGNPAHFDGVIRRNFGREKLDRARANVSELDALLSLIGR